MLQCSDAYTLVSVCPDEGAVCDRGLCYAGDAVCAGDMEQVVSCVSVALEAC